MSFKQFFKEAKEVKYEYPPSRAKFQLGDLVVVKDDGRWSMYQPKKTIPYINQVGEVVGYKNVPGAYTKYALKFSDGNTFLIHSHFLHGPFIDLKTAKKYTDPKVTIDIADIKASQKADSLTQYQKRDNVESFLKTFLPKIGYKLLDKPIEVISKDSQYVYTVFATMDIENCEVGRYGSINSVIPGKYVCYRENKISTKKLRSSTGSVFNEILGHSAYSNGLGYFIQAPERNTFNNISINNIFVLQQYGIPNNPDTLVQDELIKYFANYREELKQIKKGKYNTDLNLVKLFYKVEGDTITGDVDSNKVKLHDPYFYTPYKIIGDFNYYNFKDNITLKDLKVLPKEITGELTCIGVDVRSLSGLPKAGSYDLQRSTLNGKPITDKDIEIALMKYTLKPETAQTFSDIIDEL